MANPVYFILSGAKHGEVCAFQNQPLNVSDSTGHIWTLKTCRYGALHDFFFFFVLQCLWDMMFAAKKHMAVVQKLDEVPICSGPFVDLLKENIRFRPY